MGTCQILDYKDCILQVTSFIFFVDIYIYNWAFSVSDCDKYLNASLVLAIVKSCFYFYVTMYV